MSWATSGKAVKVRHRSAIVDTTLETLDGFRQHQSGRNAAVLAYFGVLTLFPLLMAATTILGFVLEDRPDLQKRVLDSAVDNIPVIGRQIQNNAGEISGNYWALFIGLAVALWGSLKAFVALQQALDDTWEIDIDDRANGFVKRGRALIGIAVVGLAQAASITLATIVERSSVEFPGKAAIVVGGVVLNVIVVSSMFRFLTSKDVSLSMVWPGGLATGIIFSMLQFVGASIMRRSLASMEEVYGTFAGILALMAFLSIYALVSLFGAELNAAIERRRQGLSPPPLAQSNT